MKFICHTLRTSLLLLMVCFAQASDQQSHLSFQGQQTALRSHYQKLFYLKTLSSDQNSSVEGLADGAAGLAEGVSVFDATIMATQAQLAAAKAQIDTMATTVRRLQTEADAIFQTNYRCNNGQSVHIFDGYVTANLDNLLMIGRQLDFGKNVSAAEAIAQTQTFADFPTHWIDAQGNKHDCLTPVCSGFDAKHTELFARALTFSMELSQHFGEDLSYDAGLAALHANRDNWELQGGCFQGRRNRIFLAYLSMMDFMTYT